MSTATKMSASINIRVDDATRARLESVTEKTGVSTSQVARWGIEAKLNEFEKDGFLKIEANQTAETNQKP